MNETIDWQTLSEVEKIKYDSNYLRGTIAESLVNPITGAIAQNDTQFQSFMAFTSKPTAIWIKNGRNRSWNLHIPF
jgi:hypothetical protein